MASDGIAKYAKTGTCRMCQRVRKTEYLKIVGKVRHGYATGHIWECVNVIDCDEAANRKLSKNINGVIKHKIQTALKIGRHKEYKVYT